jgi:hypothetical protein
MRTVIIIILQLLCCYSCRSNESDNAKLIRSIDEIKTINTLYQFLVDLDGRIIDTVSMQRYKKNEKGVKVFREITSLKGDKEKMVIKEYYRDNGELFYSVTETASGIFSKYENWEKDGWIYKATTVSYQAEKAIDTVSMIYKYEYNSDGKVKNMRIYESDSSLIAEVHYNQNEKPFLEFYFYNNDALSETKYEYEGEKLKSERILDKREKRETVRYFGADKLLTAEDVFINDSLVNKTVFSKDSQGNILAKVIK